MDDAATGGDEIVSTYAQRLHLLRALRDTLEDKAVEALEGARHIDRISFRVKGTTSFAKKCFQEGKDPRYANPLIDVEDQVAGRILVLFRHDIEVVHARLDGFFNLLEAERKVPVSTGEFGYESDHLILSIAEHHKPPGWDNFGDMPVSFELQVRTLFMHAWAEPQHDLGYKPGRALNDDERRTLAWIAASAWGADRALEDSWTHLGDSSNCAP